MPGPLIFVVRLLALVAFMMFFYLLMMTSPPFEGVVVIGCLSLGIVALWAKAERQSADYNKKQSERNRQRISVSRFTEPLLKTEKVIERHHYVEKESRFSIVTIIMLLCAIISTIIAIRSCAT